MSHREALARRIHANYLAKARADLTSERPALGDWDDLAEDLKEANRKQADDIERKLHAVGIQAHTVNDRVIHLFQFTVEEVELLAQGEHERWCKERRANGWKPGTVRDDANKIHPDLVPYQELSESARQKDRDVVLAIPGLLQDIGLELRRDPTQTAPVSSEK